MSAPISLTGLYRWVITLFFITTIVSLALTHGIRRDLAVLSQSVGELHNEVYLTFEANQTLGETNLALLKQRDALKALVLSQQNDLDVQRHRNDELVEALMKLRSE